MKSNKVIIAALLVAALMIMPIALFTSNDDSTAANPDPSAVDISSLYAKLMNLDPQDMKILETMGKLSGVTSYSPTAVATKNVSEKTEYGFDEPLLLNQDYVYDGETITMAAGSAVVFCVGQSFSITSAEKVGGITFEQGSSFYIVNSLAGVTKVSDITEEMTLYKNTFSTKEGESYYLRGSVNYAMTLGTNFAINAAVTITEGTAIYDTKDPSKANDKVEFPSENTVSVKLEPKADLDKKVTTITDGTAKTKIDVKATMKDETVTHVAILNGEGDYKVNASIPMTYGQDAKMTASAEGDLKFTFALDDYEATIKNSVDMSVEVDKYGTADAVTTYDGSLSFSVDYSKMVYTSADGSTVTIEGLSASAKVSLSNSGFKLSVSGGLDKYNMTTVDGFMEIKDVDIDFTYEADLDIEPPALTAPAANAPKFSWPTIALEYLNGIEEGTKDKSVKEYASEFFLGKIDGAIPYKGLTSKSIDASFSIGKYEMNGETPMVIENLRASVEISKSVGVSASFKMDKFDFTLTTMGNMRLMIQPASISLDTYTGDNKKYVFDCDFNLTGEIKMFMNGRLYNNPFINNLRGTVNLGAEMDSTTKTAKGVQDIVELKADEVTLSTYGVDLSAKNLNYDVEKKLFELNKIEVSGYYYGGSSMVKEVSGSYDNVSFTLKASLAGIQFGELIAESEEVTFTDIHNNELTVSAKYDSAQKAMIYDFESDGEYWFFDTFNDSVLTSALGIVKFKDAPEDPDSIYNFKGTIIVNHEGTFGEGTPEDSDVAVILDGKNATVSYSKFGPKFAGTFVGTIYVTCDGPGGDYAYKTYIKDNGKVYTLNMINGAALGMTVDKDGKVSYSIVALAGNELGTDTTPSGFTIGEVKDNKADVTIDSQATVLSYIATPLKYKISIDGKTVKEDVKFRSAVSVENLAKDIIMLVDKNGKICGTVNDGTWSDHYYYAYDLELTSVATKEIPTVDKTKVNDVDGQSAKFTMPTDLTAPVKFKMSSKVQFSIAQDAVAGGTAVDLTAQETKFDGKNAFIIKAKDSEWGSNIEVTFLIPISNEKSKLMHVDEYGRVTEQASKIVTVDDEKFIQATTNDFSIFYVDSDEPRYNTGGGSDNMLLFVAIGAVVAVFVVAGVFFFVKKH